MGYSTDLFGRFDLDRELTPELEKELVEFSEERHGGNTEVYEGYPNYWCQWVPTEDRKGIEWDGNEKFYNYIEWIELIIQKFLIPNNYVLNGEVNWEGEESGDIGLISVKDNVVTVYEGQITYKPEPVAQVEDATRVFFVTDSHEDNEELHETLEDAEMYAKNDMDAGSGRRIRICIVRNAFKEDDGGWNYDDQADTFEEVKTLDIDLRED